MFGFIEKDSELREKDAIYNQVLEAGLGWMHELKKGQTFRILDLEGNQAVDTTFYDLHNPADMILWEVHVHLRAIPFAMQEKKDICITAVTVLCFSLPTANWI